MKKNTDVVENTLRWVKINTDIENLDYYKVLLRLKKEIENKLEGELDVSKERYD